MLLSLLAMPLALQNAEIPNKDIIVHAGKIETARSAYDSVAPSVDAEDPVARFSDAICVASLGLPDAAEHVIVDRVEGIAASVGLRVGGQGCAPNLFILFVPDSKGAVRKLARHGSPAISSKSLDDIRQIDAQPYPVKAWIESEVRSRDGDRQLHKKNNEAAQLAVATSSHLSLPIRTDILSATILIDKDAVAGVNLKQIADYSAVRALTGAHPDTRLGTRSILSLFSVGARLAPGEYTAFDKGYLKGLYGGNGDLPNMIKRSQIIASIARLESLQAK